MATRRGKKAGVDLAKGPDWTVLSLGPVGAPTMLHVRIRSVFVKTRAMITIGSAADPTPERIAGALVRVRLLPGDVGDPEVIKAGLLQAGAEAVKVDPAPQGPAVVIAGQDGPAPARQRPREVVEAMVAEAVGVDREALSVLVQRVLAEEGI